MAVTKIGKLTVFGRQDLISDCICFDSVNTPYREGGFSSWGHRDAIRFVLPRR